MYVLRDSSLTAIEMWGCELLLFHPPISVITKKFSSQDGSVKL